ncbi:MAG: hypothetical protein ABI905_18320 [Betaproteobacteria bacterium]
MTRTRTKVDDTEGIALEAYLAKLYTDASARAYFLSNPRSAAIAEGVSASDAEALCYIDKTGLHMAADSYAHKREQHRAVKKGFYESLRDWMTRR